jgi:hypothetical protein
MLTNIRQQNWFTTTWTISSQRSIFTSTGWWGQNTKANQIKINLRIPLSFSNQASTSLMFSRSHWKIKNILNKHIYTPSISKYKQKLVNKSKCIWSKSLTIYIKFLWLIFAYVLGLPWFSQNLGLKV